MRFRQPWETLVLPCAHTVLSSWCRYTPSVLIRVAKLIDSLYPSRELTGSPNVEESITTGLALSITV